MTQTQSIRLKSDLQGELADRIRSLIRQRPQEIGDRLREAVLSRELGVSRSPIRAALLHLVAEGILEPDERGGYNVVRVPPIATSPSGQDEPASSLYARMLKDIIVNEMPDPATESAMMRRYDAGRGEIIRVVRRLMREGLAEPLPGHGWTMMRLDSEQLARSYHLRAILEPALLLDRAYETQTVALERLRGEHYAMLETLSPDSPWQPLFELDASFHEILASGSGNELVVDIIRRQNRLRRLAEYVSYGRLERIQESMKEHIAIIEAMLRDDRNWASAMLRQHLGISSLETTQNYARDLDAVRAGANKFLLTE